MQVTLVDHTDNPVEKIGKYAAICYDANIEPEACVRRTRMCFEKGHLSTLRFAYATFHISGISRACSHQLVRHKHLDYLQESQRYVEQTNTDYVIPHITIDSQKVMDAHYKLSQSIYDQLIASGIRKEDARYVLPNAAATQLYVTGNLQAWKDFLKLREEPAAQWEIRKVAQRVREELHNMAPEIF